MQKRSSLFPNRLLKAGTLLLLFIAALSLLAPLICRYDPYAQDLYSVLLPPSAEHLCGTDQLGRDVFSRLLYAGRYDLAIMFLAEAVPFVTGVAAGMAAGYFGGRTDWIITLVTDTVIAFPFYLAVIIIAFVAGAGAKGIFLTFILVGWVSYARVVRGQTMTLKEKEWVKSAQLTGFSGIRILWSQILVNVLPQAVIVLAANMVRLLVMIVTLGYLGIGIAPPTPDWGTMISEGRTFVTTAWWLSVLPGLCVVLTGIALSLIGDGLAQMWRHEEG